MGLSLIRSIWPRLIQFAEAASWWDDTESVVNSYIETLENRKLLTLQTDLFDYNQPISKSYDISENLVTAPVGNPFGKQLNAILQEHRIKNYHW